MTVTDALDLARKWMSIHGLDAWEVVVRKATSYLGLCEMSKKRIALSEYFIRSNTEAEVLDVVLHEIAHALCPPREGHGKAWKAMAKRIGARPERCATDAVKMPVIYNFVMHCPVCGHQFKRQRIKKRRRYFCGMCWQAKRHTVMRVRSERGMDMPSETVEIVDDDHVPVTVTGFNPGEQLRLFD